MNTLLIIFMKLITNTNEQINNKNNNYQPSK